MYDPTLQNMYRVCYVCYRPMQSHMPHHLIRISLTRRVNGYGQSRLWVRRTQMDIDGVWNIPKPLDELL